MKKPRDKKGLSEKDRMMVRRLGVLALVTALFIVAVWVNYDQQQKGNLPVSVSVRGDHPASALTPAPTDRTADETADTVPSVKTGSDDYYVLFREDRAKIRAEEIQLLDSVIQGEDSDSVKDASRQKINLAQNMEKEFAVEKLITAKGFADAAAIVREDQVVVAVKQEKLSQMEVNIIMAVIVQETQEDLANIKIIPAP